MKDPESTFDSVKKLHSVRHNRGAAPAPNHCTAALEDAHAEFRLFRRGS